MTVKQLRETLFPRFGEPLQIMFSLPQYGAHVLLKSFEIFHNEVNVLSFFSDRSKNELQFLMEKRKNRLKDSLWSAPENEIQRYRPTSPKQFQFQGKRQIVVCYISKPSSWISPTKSTTAAATNSTTTAAQSNPKGTRGAASCSCTSSSKQ